MMSVAPMSWSWSRMAEMPRRSTMAETLKSPFVSVLIVGDVRPGVTVLASSSRSREMLYVTILYLVAVR
ncbi:hypothetical protein PybrP1_013182 [[Pythium] brassicae (nom. inval.)]|nr:hypothetical protein PybrP1_013182 [[Pythium] brassicae (nom. inval.)]